MPLLPVAVIALIPIAFVAMHIVRRIVVLRRALGDFGNEETFEGYVVRVPWGWVKRGDDRVWEPTGYTAVDDGRTDEVRARPLLLRFGGRGRSRARDPDPANAARHTRRARPPD